MRENEDRVTLRETLQPKNNASPMKEERLEQLANQMNLYSLLDLPMVALSNGQRRRARIVKAILGDPELLLLDEPFSMSLSRTWETV